MKTLLFSALLILMSLSGFATVITVSASASGYTSTTTKSSGSMLVDNTTNRGYAVFNLASAGIPASATITSVKVTFTHVKAGTGTATYRINGYVGDISSLSASSLYTAAGSATSLYTASWGNASTTKTMTTTAAADTFAKHNLSGTISLAWVMSGSTRSYNVTGAPSPYITVTYTCATPTGVTATASPASVCSGSSLTLTGAATGGATYQWRGPNSFSSTLRNPTAFTATAPAAGIYTFTATSACGVSTTATTTVTVKTAPSAISGSSNVCVGGTTLLTNTAALGTWSTSSFTRASVNSSTGLVVGRSAGTVNISYTTGCGSAVGLAMNVRTTPAAITGATGVCIAGSTTLSNTTAGGTWSTSNAGIASINSSTGAVYGVAAGTVTMTYDNLGCGTPATYSMTSNNSPSAISGASTICSGATTTLTNTVAGGVWSTSSVSRASIDAASGLVTGTGSGSVTMSYNTGCGSAATLAMTANTSPNAITGTASACTGAVSTLACTPAGGAWTTANAAIASVNASGTVYGVAHGIANISYTRAGCASSIAFTAKIAPATITGAANICAGLLDTLGNTSLGGTWTSSNTSVATVTSATGIVTGVSAGSINISYSTGCGSAVGTSISIYTSPAPITGAATVCNGTTVTLANATGGGSWTSSNPSVASVNASGVVRGIGQGNATISYSIGSCIATRTQTTINSPASISGTTAICIGGSSTLSNTANGGTWTSSNPAVASIDNSGLVTSLTTGSTTINYSTGCGSAAAATVNVGTTPAAITGATDICSDYNTTLTQTVAGGTWSTSDAAVASVSNTGVVTGVSEGHPTISYTLTNGCGTNYATYAMNVALTGKWIGVNSDWNDPNNWPCNVVPDATINVTIPAGTSFLPDITGADYMVKNMTIASGVTLPINGDANFQVKGNLNVSGTINGDGYVVMSGSSAQAFAGNGSVSNLKVENASGVTGTTGDTLNITNALNVATGTLTTNGSIKLKSDAMNTARVENVGGAISGNVTVEKYFTGGRRAYRFVAHPFSNSINVSQVGARIDVTGPGGTSNGFTQTGSNAPSAYWYNPMFGNSALGYDPGWRSFTSANGTPDTNLFKRYQGIRLFVRGSKGQGLGYDPYTPNAATLSITGTLNYGTQNINLRKSTNSDYNMIGNPYASPVNIGSAIAAAQAGGQVTGAAFYVWNPFLGSAGAFQSKPIGGSYIIDQCTSFQVRADHDNATLTISESDKAADATEVLLKETPTDHIELNVYDAAYHQWDGTSIKFDGNASANEDSKADAIKMTNPDLNFYSLSANNQKLSIDARPFTEGAIIPLGFTTNVAQEYIIKAESISVPAGKVVTLYDRLTNTSTVLNSGTEYHFAITANASSQGENRFELRSSGSAVTTTTNGGFEVAVAPNPATSNITVSFNAGTAENTSINIFNAAGEKVMNQNLGLSQSGKVNLSLAQLSAGIYFVNVASGKESKTVKLVIE